MSTRPLSPRQAAALAVLLLAAQRVRSYRRLVNGRPQQVREYERNWIPRQDWIKGQQEWIARGEAAWKARGAAADRAADAAEAAQDRAQAARDAAEARAWPGIHEAARKIMRSPEGFTVNPRTGEEPQSGYVVARVDHTHLYPAEIMGDEERLSEAIRAMVNSGDLPEDAYLGGWVHEGKLWLEPSDVVADQAEAERLGQARNQIAIFDLRNGREIQTGGTGGGRITEHDAEGNVIRSYTEGAGGSDSEGVQGSPGGRAEEDHQEAGQGSDRGTQAGRIIGRADIRQISDLMSAAERNGWTSEWASLRDALAAARDGDESGVVNALRKAILAARRKDIPGGVTHAGHDRAVVYRDLAAKIVPGFVQEPRGSPQLKPDPAAAVTGFLGKTAPAVPALLSDGSEALQEAWDGKPVTLFNGRDRPGILADIGWDGHISMQRETAESIRQALSSDGIITAPGAFTVPLHELIHGTVPDGWNRRRDARAYRDFATAQIEEGFTELSAIQHAAEFFDKAGIGDRETAYIAPGAPDNPAWAEAKSQVIRDLRDDAQDYLKSGYNGQIEVAESLDKKIQDAIYDLLMYDDLEPVRDVLWRLQHEGDKHLHAAAVKARADLEKLDQTSRTKHSTMAEYAQRVADPAGVLAGHAWGHYPEQVKAAQDWVLLVAREEGLDTAAAFPGTGPGHGLDSPVYKRIVQLTDEISREGADGKIPAMAKQLVRAMSGDPELAGKPQAARLLDSVQENIRAAFSKDLTNAGRNAFNGSKTAATRQLRDLKDELDTGTAAQVSTQLPVHRKVWITYPSAPDRAGYVVKDTGGPKVKVRWYSQNLASPQVHEQWIPRERLKQR